MSEHPTPVGLWGLGNMGVPMAARLVAAGIPVLGFDPSPAARDRFVAVGGTPVDGPDALGDVRIVILMLPNSDVVEDVLLRGGLADGLRPGSVVVDMSSSEPLRTRALAELLRDRGLTLIDAPVSGGVGGAREGTLAIMVGGDEAVVAELEPLLAHVGSPRRVGSVGAGHALKALNNLLSATHLWVTSEAMHAGVTFGLEPEVMLEVFNGSSGRSGSTENKWPNFILPGSYDSGFALKLMLKDMRIATDLAHRLGATVELGDAAVEQWTRASHTLSDDADHTEVARHLAERNGVNPRSAAI